MIILTQAPLFHMGPEDTCKRCEWQRLHYNLVHWVRVRGDYKV